MEMQAEFGGETKNPITFMLSKMREKFPNPSEATIPEVVEFVMATLKEYSDLSSDELEMVKMRLQ